MEPSVRTGSFGLNIQQHRVALPSYHSLYGFKANLHVLLSTRRVAEIFFFIYIQYLLCKCPIWISYTLVAAFKRLHLHVQNVCCVQGGWRTWQRNQAELRVSEPLSGCSSEMQRSGTWQYCPSCLSMQIQHLIQTTLTCPVRFSLLIPSAESLIVWAQEIWTKILNVSRHLVEMWLWHSHSRV